MIFIFSFHVDLLYSDPHSEDLLRCQRDGLRLLKKFTFYKGFTLDAQYIVVSCAYLSNSTQFIRKTETFSVVSDGSLDTQKQHSYAIFLNVRGTGLEPVHRGFRLQKKATKNTALFRQCRGLWQRCLIVIQFAHPYIAIVKLYGNR